MKETMITRCNCFIAFLILSNIISVVSNAAGKPPNLIVIFTDEHNLRTLGCYRDLMTKKQAYVWGDGVAVETPHIDSLARDGALFSNFNTVAPLCTPSRASFMTGLYPYFTGAYMNHQAMDDDAVTWARILQLNGYTTGFVGKWHLDGDKKPDFADGNPHRGFNYTKYMFNRGHWKFFDETDNGEVKAYDYIDKDKFEGKFEEHYATDFLFEKGKKFIMSNVRQGNPFGLMMSIPDPHGPNDVRPPYNKMYRHFDFKLPQTAVAAYNKQPALPGWSAIHTDLELADEIISDVENDKYWQAKHQQYFGMVKLLDDSVGELVAYLRTTGQFDRTIIAFSSDHGDLMGEHAKYNKGKPYFTSAGIPMIIHYPDGIRKGKRVKTSYSSPDFAPTILNLMGIDTTEYNFQGIDGSADLRDDQRVNSKEQVRFITDSKQAKWVAATDREFKLVLSQNGSPYLFDMNEDPDELVNYYDHDKKYKDVTKRLQGELFNAIKNYKFSIGDHESFLFDAPFCTDSADQLPSLQYRLCSDLKLAAFERNCNIKSVKELCPKACKTCCEDSKGLMWLNANLVTCADVKKWRDCDLETTKLFCPVTCQTCKPEPSPAPSQIPTTSHEPSPSPSEEPTTDPSTSPTRLPSSSPSEIPSHSPSVEPSVKPSPAPSQIPTTSLEPSPSPSEIPSHSPSHSPSDKPSDKPSQSPSTNPSDSPTFEPSSEPSLNPSRAPSPSPSEDPSKKPSDKPSESPSSKPSVAPSERPSEQPSKKPTTLPSTLPSVSPTDIPSEIPSSQPSNSPSGQPTSLPSVIPTMTPTSIPSAIPSSIPTSAPSNIPSVHPSRSPSSGPTSKPSSSPSDKPSLSPSTSASPSNMPSSDPSDGPTSSPSMGPSVPPSDKQTASPSDEPSTSAAPSESKHPSMEPSITMQPSSSPSSYPTRNVTMQPSENPSEKPTEQSSEKPSEEPTEKPSEEPTEKPVLDWMVNFGNRALESDPHD